MENKSMGASKMNVTVTGLPAVHSILVFLCCPGLSELLDFLVSKCYDCSWSESC
jgi:hypothetical protein